MQSEFKVSHQQEKSRRKPLEKILPLKTPLSMQIELASACNFKCRYCLHNSKQLKESGFQSGIMDYDLFLQIVEQLKEFPDKLEFISLQSRGEPFINKRLSDMIKCLKNADVTKEIAINTNATFLNPKINREIVDAGLDGIRISIQGVSSGQYKQICGVDIDFDKLVENITDLYENRKGLDAYIKIIDVDMTEEDKSRFIEIFTPISDRIFIENPADIWNGAELEVDFKNNRYNYTPKRIMVCPRIFFAMVVHYNGNIIACSHDWEETLVLGNVRNDSLPEIWNGEKFRELRIQHLQKKGRERELCNNCGDLEHAELEDIDDYADELLQKFID